MPAVHQDLASEFIPTDRALSKTIDLRQVILRDRVTVATLVPFSCAAEVPRSLLRYLSDQLNKEIEKGDTYSMLDVISLKDFGPYWFSNFGAIMLLGDIKSLQEVLAMDRTANWAKLCLGSFNIRPNYPGRSSHICNGMFLVTDAARNRGVGRLMGEVYLEWAPKLGYTYAMFNLVYENNVASCRIWDALGFKRIGKVPGAGRLCASPGEYVDAIIYGRDLNPEGDDLVTQDRFDKIRYYLKHLKYPRGADRAEKSRLRSAATHYKLIGGKDGEPEKLMLKDKEVVSDPQQQYEIAQHIHAQQHAGINKTTAAIAVKYHWVRIKETVSRVIRDCPQCRETLKISPVNNHEVKGEDASSLLAETGQALSQNHNLTADHTMEDKSADPPPSSTHFVTDDVSAMPETVDAMGDYTTMPLDPQIIDINSHLPRFQHHAAIADHYAEVHGLQAANFGDPVHRNPGADYQMLMDDGPDPDSLRRESLALVHGHVHSHVHVHEAHHEQEMLAKYVERSEDDLDFT
ncbi:hypothetical protein ASPZODRAFT_131017 [Penicilliopsis zonata CBS 506.65]|uniref:N-acetyltransferase domain-containing protein n=1 Tax=Penicilliopsis zonata CBS 506.65 TaxID=1073090 RepID=A0A1L9SJW3_9EURO|nr:hypothetical protein ASPZODRAFT_131017 [Penicilliopsis zonata CBS 506.65]OJJ47510.1 hypothetical protein ASPZODRAFT_131017 [Penicilliopsis zonata CBS 506.65]